MKGVRSVSFLYSQTETILEHSCWKNMKEVVLNIIVLLISCVCYSCSTSSEMIKSKTMERQANEFLSRMPINLQHCQALAVRNALNGDNGNLISVRNSRNIAAQYSPDVVSRMLTNTMRIYEPRKHSSEKLPLLIYFHGGGWTFGSINSCSRYCDAMAASCKVKVIAVDYRLAPENPFPTGLEDCINSVLYAIENSDILGIDIQNISLGGDSSGGNLAISTALDDKIVGKVKSLILFYPVTKAFDDGSESWKKYGVGYGLDFELMTAFNDAYISGGNPMDSRISVGLCSDDELKNLPHTLLVAAGRDILRDQGIEFAQKAKEKVTRIEFTDAVHLFITVPGQDEAFARAVELSLKMF